jgi:hypothetical protein
VEQRRIGVVSKALNEAREEIDNMDGIIKDAWRELKEEQ